MFQLVSRRFSSLVLCFLMVLSIIVVSGCGKHPGTTPSEELTLDNGMRILLLPHPGSGLVASNVFVGAGSTREEDRYAGSSHFLEHVLFNGTNRRTQEQIYADGDRIGAYNNATTQLEFTHFMMVAPAERLAEALDIQADMLLHSTLPPKKFEKERGIILEELSKDKDDPDYRLEAVLDTLLYGAESDFARPVLGTAQTIRALPRSMVVAYYQRQYVPSNMRMVLMGDFQPDEALETIHRLFRSESRSADKKSKTEPPLPAPICALGAPGTMAMAAVDAPQTVVRLTAFLPEESPEDDAALALLSEIAGGNKSSRLERALAETTAIVHQESSSSVLYRQGGRLLELRVRLSEGAAPRAAATRLLAALRSLENVGTTELEAARTTLLTQEISRLEQLHYYALFHGDRLWHMPEGFTQRYLAALEQADTASVSQWARRVLAKATVQIVAAGPGIEPETAKLASLEPKPERVHDLESAGSVSLPALHPHRPSPLAADQPPEVVHLDNGLTLVLAATPHTRMFAVHVLVENRSLREPAEYPGIADLLHRSLAIAVEGNRDKGPSRLDRIGAELKVADNPWIPYDNYYTTPLYSFFRLQCVDEYYPDALDLLAEMLRGPNDDPRTLEEARKEMLAAIGRSAARPSAKAGARFRELLYPGHPLSRSVMGDGKDLAAVTPQVLAQFGRKYLSPDQLVVAVVGNVPREEALDAIRNTLGALQPVSQPTAKTPSLPLTGKSVREVIPGGGNQSALRMGRVLALAPEDRWALVAAVRIASSRMQQDLRETRGLAYSLGISAGFLGDRAIVTASMGTRPENLDEAEAEMRSYLTAGDLTVTPDELETAVNEYLSRIRMRRVTSMGQAFALSRDVFLGRGLDYAEREARGLTSVTPEDVRRAAKRYLSDSPLVTVIAR